MLALCYADVMREIKFRVWNGEVMMYNAQNLYDGMRVSFNKQGDFYDNWDASERSFGEILENEKNMVMQFTGLLDKNKKEIFEGDICKIPKQWWHPREDKAEKKYQYVIKFEDGAFGKFNEGDWSVSKDDHEVIGNIYENPELLK